MKGHDLPWLTLPKGCDEARGDLVATATRATRCSQTSCDADSTDTAPIKLSQLSERGRVMHALPTAKSPSPGRFRRQLPTCPAERLQYRRQEGQSCDYFRSLQ